MGGLGFFFAGDLGGDEQIASPSVINETIIDFFGVDLLFFDDLQVTASGDYADVQGMPALKQALRCRLLTSPGEYQIRPDYGCGLQQFVKKRASQSEKDALRQRIIDQLSQEDRVQSVEEVTLEDLNAGAMTGIKIFLRIIALGRENSFILQTFAD